MFALYVSGLARPRFKASTVSRMRCCYSELSALRNSIKFCCENIGRTLLPLPLHLNHLQNRCPLFSVIFMFMSKKECDLVPKSNWNLKRHGCGVRVWIESINPQRMHAQWLGYCWTQRFKSMSFALNSYPTILQYSFLHALQLLFG